MAEVGRLGVAAALSLLAGCFSPPPPRPSDAQMLAELRAHRAELEQLAAMAGHDRQLARVSDTWYRDARGENHEVPIAGLLDHGRWERYLLLIRRLQLDTGVSIDSGGLYFDRSSEGLVIHDSIKGFARLPVPPGDHLCASVDRIPRDGERDGICYRPIEGKWYLFLEWTGI